MREKAKQKETEWRPNPRQVAMAHLLVNPEDRRTKTDKMKEVGVSRKTFYDWMKDKRYLAYLDGLQAQYIDSELPDIWRAIIRRAKSGDMSAAKTVLEARNKLAPQKVEVTGKDGKPIESELRIICDYGDGPGG